MIEADPGLDDPVDIIVAVRTLFIGNGCLKLGLRYMDIAVRYFLQTLQVF